jgi:hypothetical protein
MGLFLQNPNENYSISIDESEEMQIGDEFDQAVASKV